MSDLFRYAAFISYSSKDAAFAGRLHKELEGYAIPKSLGAFDLIGGGKKNRIYPVFRDREELSAGDLGDRIEAALKASSALIVVCSPHSAASPWVQKEIDYFVSLGRRDRVFAIIHDGAPHVDEAGVDATPLCFPPAFRGDALVDEAALEPLAADARRGKDGFRNAWLKIVAGLIGVGAGALQDRDLARQRGRRTALMTAVTLLALGGGYTAAWVDARNWRADLSAYPEIVAAQAGAIDPTPFAIAGVGNPGLVVPARGVRSDQILARAAPTKLLSLGKRNYAVSQNGRILVVSTDRSAAVYDRVINLKIRDLGPVFGFTLSENGAALVTQDHNKAQTWTYYDLTRPGAPARSLGANAPGGMYGYVVSANGASLLVKNFDSTATFYDLAHGGATRTLGRLGDLAGHVNVVDWDVSANGATMATRMKDGSIALYDLAGGGRRQLPPLPAPADTSMRMNSRVNVTLSRNGETIALNNTDHAIIYDVKSGHVLLKPPPSKSIRPGVGIQVSLSDDGRTAIYIRTAPVRYMDGDMPITRETRVSTLYDLSNGAPLIELDRGVPMRMSSNGMVVAAWTQEGIAVHDRARGTVRTLPRANTFDLSATGARLLARQNLEDGSYDTLQLVSHDLKNDGAGVEVGVVASSDNIVLSAAGGNAAAIRANGEALLFDLARPGAPRQIGSGLNHQYEGVFVADDTLFVASRRGDESVVAFDLVAPSPVVDARGHSLRGADLAASECAVNGDWLAPFVAGARGASAGERTREATRVNAILAGRPWNPCDWRGLLSGPEGWAQWWRRVEVAVLGRNTRDYQCGEINAAGAVSDRRIDACRLAEVPEHYIAGADLPDPYEN